ncbi:restriction endonuclease subunit S [Oscillatoria sp. FACHB-1406]|uniref:restriction endonuclease subunit S n=1 Tax=Oscillatoria sp. FACHB-1406 TaxID=2692846 RepID=UPI0016869880|nr:restriction endonuclease subunit S [Oscillatoria sp. FACHB-1406]MBD2577078.1 restriction endonuclease subunit S [Oscillatoria sp. FACHB-1406]
MSKKLNKKCPKLRFPEFDGDWDELTISDIGEVIRGASPRPKGDRRYYGGKIPRLMVEDVTRDGKYVTPRTDFLTEEGAKLSRPCEKGTLTIVCSGTVGIPSFLAVDACIHDGFLAIRKLNKEVVNEDFLYHQLNTLRNTLESSATHGGVFTNLTTEVLKNFKIKVTSIAEQEKIASFLGAIATRLTQLRRKRELLQTYKRGVMQKLFSQQIRFTQSDGSPFPNWEEKKLGKVIELISGRHLAPDEYQTGKGKIPYFTGPSDFTNNFLELTKWAIIPAQTGKSGDILITVKGNGVGEMLFLQLNEVAIGRQLMSIRPTRVNGAMLYQKLFNYRKTLQALAAGNIIPGLSRGDLLNLNFFLPSISEQEKIANFLTTIDRKIEALSRQIEQTEKFKKGLLQKLFV